MEQEDLRELENRWIHECALQSMALCPVDVDVKAMIAAMCAGDFVGAAAVFQSKVPFPGIISLVCDHLCQNVCRRLSIMFLERAALRLRYGSPKRISIRPLRGKGKRVAVVGAGLSGLTAALELTKMGHRIVLFEESFSLGGSVWDYPKTVLPRKVIKKDFDIVRDSLIRIRFGRALGRDITLSDLEEDYDATFLGVGVGFTWFEQIEKDESGRVKADPSTFQTAHPGVFAAGSLVSEADRKSSIRSIWDGQRAAIFIDQYLQGLSLATSPEHEGPCDTKLFTTTVGKEFAPLLK